MPRLKLTPEQRAAIAAAPKPPTIETLGLGEPKPRKPRRSMLGTLGGPGPWRIVIEGWHPEGTVNNLIGKSIGHITGLKRKDEATLFAHLLGVVPAATGRRRLRVTLVYPKGRKSHDADNPEKSIRDGLVRIGALVDDSREWLDSAESQAAVGGKATILEMEDC